jgi:hypothetical protein
LINELIQLRQEFWSKKDEILFKKNLKIFSNLFYLGSKKENRRSWQIIQRACETDHATAELILSNSGLVCLDGNMKCIVDTASGVVFNLPNFCINDPYYKKEFLKPEEVPEKMLAVRIIKKCKIMQKFFLTKIKISKKIFNDFSPIL